MRYLVGDWMGTSDAPGIRVQDVESVEWTLNQQFLVFHAKTLEGVRGLERTSFLGRDRATGEYTLTIVDGTGCVAALRGAWADEVFRFEGESCLGRMTLVIEEENPDRYRIRTSFVDAKGDTVTLPVVVRERMATPFVGREE